jgi:glc operon protein GlcG
MNETPPAGSAPSTSVPPPYGPPITLEAARRVVAAAEAFAVQKDWPVVIAVLDSAGHLKLLHRLDQVNLAAIELAQRKASTAIRFRRPTRAFEEIVNGGGVRVLSMLDEVVALEGGLPLVRDGVIVGSIGVSGMSSPEDGLIAAAGAAVLAQKAGV